MRKSGNPEEALSLYRELYSESADEYIVAGLIYCLRKTNRFDEAIPLCDLVFSDFLNNEWCRKEAIWTLIQGKLEKLDETASTEQVASVVNNIFRFNPDDAITVWRVVRRLLKTAKAHGNWKAVVTWIDKVDFQQLSDEPMRNNSGREGWSDKAIWYNYKIRSLIEFGDKEMAIRLAKEASNKYLRQHHFFSRLEALANFRLSRTKEAEQIYATLCDKAHSEWWILHEYAKVLKELGKQDLALKVMCKAATESRRLESLVSLFADIGTLCMEMGNKEAARNHFLLCKMIRQEHGWSIPNTL